MTSRKVAVVTGANKGIGFEIVKGLCEKFDGIVYLTARDSGRGQDAVDKLKALGYSPVFHQLDITDQNSVNTFRDYLKSKHCGLDVLVNNAAIAYQSDTTESMSVQGRETLGINYYGTKRICDALFPLLRQNARVVNVSSSAGHLSCIPSADLRAKFHHEKLTITDVDKLMEKFQQDADNGTYKEYWGDIFAAYVAAKVGLSCITFIQQRLFDAEIPNRNISINSVHPGYIVTDMTRELRTRIDGALPPVEGAEAPLFLALEADFKGQYVWEDGSVVDWYAPSAQGFTNRSIPTTPTK